MKPSRVAYYDGESPEDAEAFASAVLASWAAMHDRESARPRPVSVRVTGKHAPAFPRSTMVRRAWCQRTEYAEKHRGWKLADGTRPPTIKMPDGHWPSTEPTILESSVPMRDLAAELAARRGIVPEPTPEKIKKSPKGRTARKPRPPMAHIPPAKVPDGSCPRCGRMDFRSAVGRSWHIDMKYRKPGRHVYAA